MNRIIEAFTKAHCQLTAIDDIIIAAVIIFVLGVCLLIYSLFVGVIDK